MLKKIKIKKIIKKNSKLKLHLGCGRHILDTWINIDTGNTFNNPIDLDLKHDLSQGLPFPNNSATYVFHEHLIEHLTRKEGLFLTKEIFRVLKKNGVLRVAYPDLDQAITDYNNNYKNYEWYYKIYPNRQGLTKSEIFNLDFREYGEHKHIYNKEDIKKLLSESGFQEKISFYKPKESNQANLMNLEKRMNSICLEAIK